MRQKEARQDNTRARQPDNPQQAETRQDKPRQNEPTDEPRQAQIRKWEYKAFWFLKGYSARPNKGMRR